jgi:hypothetical protein
MTSTEHTNKSGLYWLLKNSFRRIKDSIKSVLKNRPILAILLLIVLIYLLITGRASLQPIAVFARKNYLLILIILLAFRLFLSLIGKYDWKGRLLVSAGMLMVVAMSYWLGPKVYRYLALYYHYESLHKVELGNMPLTGHERIQPLNSIKTLINQEALSETQDATFPHFVRGNDDRYYFTSCIGPSKAYKIQQFTENMYEMLEVPADLPSPNFSGSFRSDVEFVTGELLLFSKNAHTSARKRFNLHQFFNYQPADIYYLRNDQNEWVQVVSLIKWEGFLFPRPVFGGLMIQEQKGENNTFVKRLFLGHGKFILPQEVKNYKYLEGQNIIPRRVARFSAECFRFSNGFLAPMPGYHNGDIRIPNLPMEQDPQPFIVYAQLDRNTKGQLFNYFGLEPYEESKKGLNLSVFIPGDGTETVYFLDHKKRSESFIGSSAVSAKIVESKKNYDWSENYPVESRPYVRFLGGKNRLFWLSTIVTKAGKEQGEYIGGSIPEITLTDANYGKVVWIEQDSLINSNNWEAAIERALEPFWSKE